MSEQKPGPEADETLLRGSQSENAEKSEATDSSADETVIRGANQASSDDETVIRGDTPNSPAHSSTKKTGDTRPVDPGEATVIRGSDASGQPAAGADDATVIRGEAAAADDATVIRGDKSTPDAATIIREPGDAATILRSGSNRGSEPDAATILRGGDDGDRTVIANPDDDATVLSVGGDTTMFANADPMQKPSKGSSEAGRLLKNRFVLEEKVGSGGMGDVYKALDLRQQEAQERNPYIAIKILNESFARHKDAFISLQRETTRTRGIPHPNIMAVYDFDKEGDTVFMSMELLDGKPLDDYLKEHTEGVSTEDAWNIIDGICQGLGRAHGAGIVHSDFKPGNIYYTKNKTAKVFDFGIARAVSNPNELEADGEKTVFDAGSLGALTPTYASYEMLKGLEPTKSDDVYAVALVAYELFTGKHPYNRVPADKALERGIEPEAPPNLKRRHWRALRKALEIKGENRTQTIDEFYEGMFSEDPPYLRYAAIAAVLVASIGFGVYQQFFGTVEQIPQEFTDTMAEYTTAQGNVVSRIKSPDFDSEAWHQGVEVGINAMAYKNIELQDDFAEYLDEDWEAVAKQEIDITRREIMTTYLAQIDTLRTSSELLVTDTGNMEEVQSAIDELTKASELLAIVKDKYNFDFELITQSEIPLVQRIATRESNMQQILAQAEADRIEAERVEAARLAREKAENERLERNRIYKRDIAEFERILRCKGDIAESDIYGEKGLQGILSSMRSNFPEQYALDKPGIVAALAGCIEQRVAVRAPERARNLKAAFTGFLPGEARLANIEIVDLDPCAKRGLAGQGSRNRQWCEDQLAAGGTGPELVVIPKKPGASDSEPLGVNFAMSRVEIRIGDYNQYCTDVGCEKLSGPSALPATRLSLEQAQAYALWLSDQSGKTYRIPTVDEWMYAATTNGTAQVDENVNCTVDSRGVRLGERLLNTLSGKPNNWGLYNHVGNAREWAVSGEELLALGGAHTDPKAECTMSKSVAHSGQADNVTGFRLVREIRSGDAIIETNSAD